MSTVRELMAAGTQTILAQALVGSVTRSATATGTTQADALPFSTGAIYVTTVASGTGVRLVGTSDFPATIGDQQTVYNYGANTLAVYPPVGETITPNALNAATSLAPSTSCTFKKVANATWLPGAGSTAADISFTQSGTGMVAETVQAALRNYQINAKSANAKGDNATDDATALNAALTAASVIANGGTIVVPPGTYLCGSTVTVPANVTLRLQGGAKIKNTGAVNPLISLTVGSGGTSGNIVGDGFNSIIEYTGTGDAVFANGTAQSQADLQLSNVWIKGSSAGASGLRLKAFNGCKTLNLKVSGFTTGDGIKNEGANAVTHINPEISGNLNGIHNLTTQVAAVNYSSNVVVAVGGQILSNTGWGWYEDPSGSGGTNIGNRAIGVVFEANGVNASTTTGNVFVQLADSFQLTGCYLEYGAGLVPANSVLIGDGSNAPNGTVISGNVFLSKTATNAIQDVNGQSTFISGNLESGTPTNFVNHGTAARGLYLGPNRAAAAANYFAGSDTGLDSVIVGGAGTNSNQQGATTLGYGFNAITGYGQDLVIRTRTGGTNNQVWKSIAGGSLGGISDSGVMAAGTGLANNFKFSMGVSGTEWGVLEQSHSSQPYGVGFSFSAAAPNNTTNYFGQYRDNVGTKAVIYSNGNWQNLNNSYGAISDVKLKENIELAGSQWADIKALGRMVCKYTLKSDDKRTRQIGLIAQDVEKVSPGLVYESDDLEHVEVKNEQGESINEVRLLGTKTKGLNYSVLYMKAVKALGEALERIEALEAKHGAPR